MLEMWHNITEYLKLLNTVSILVRILLAAVGGSLIGLNRRKAGQPAGMRTHMLVQRIINNCYIKPMPLPLH